MSDACDHPSTVWVDDETGWKCYDCGFVVGHLDPAPTNADEMAAAVRAIVKHHEANHTGPWQFCPDKACATPPWRMDGGGVMGDLTDFLLARIAEDQEALPVLGDEVEIIGGRYVNYRERVLADCEAKRRIVTVMQDNPTDWGVRVAAFYLAQVYADHPDYREEWRP